MEKQKKKQTGITLIALVISIIVMLILAGVSLNMTVGENGIITKAQNANLQNQMAQLQEYIDQFYMLHYDEFEGKENKAAALQSISQSRNWIYKGKLGYIPDSDGYVHYFLVIENMPSEINDSITYGKGEKTYNDYVNCKDVFGITENLQVYYCSDGQSSIDGVELANLSQENGADKVFEAGSAYAKLIKGNLTSPVTKADLRGIQSFTVDGLEGITDLNELYNFTNLRDLTLKDMDLSSLDGIEYLAKLYRIYIIRCTVDDYSRLKELSNQIQYLFLEDTTNDEVELLCDNQKGIGGKDFPNLAYFGIYGKTHYRIDRNYDDISDEDSISTYDSTVKHAEFSDISYLSNLSTLTKQRITNLFLNNNSLTSITNLWEFSGVERLRIEDNYITNLSGLHNATSKKGMTDLLYLYAYSNLLSDSETVLNTSTDCLSVFSNTTYNETSGLYSFSAKFNNLKTLALQANSVKNLNYLSNNDALETIYIQNNSNLNLDSGIQSVLHIFEKDGFSLNCDTYVSDYIVSNSKKIHVIDLPGKTMTASSFSDFMSGRGAYLKKLNLYNFKLKDNTGTYYLTDETTPTYDTVINSALENSTAMIGLNLRGCQYLTSIEFTKNMSELVQIDLRNTGVLDLNNLVNFCPNLNSVILNNEALVVANEADENGYAPITAIEALFNKIYDNTSESANYRFYSYIPGVVLASKSLIDQLSKSTNITQFMSGYYQIGRVLGDEDIVFDLRKTQITKLWYRSPGSNNGDTFLLPSTCTKVEVQNCVKLSGNKLAWTIGDECISSLTNLTTIKGDNAEWDTFWTMASKLPNINTISYYHAGLDSDSSLQNYVEKLSKNSNLRNIYIYGYLPYKEKSTFGTEQIKYLGQIPSLRKIAIQKFSQVKDVGFLSGLTNLNYLEITDCGVTSLDCIKNLTTLAYIDVQNNPIERQGYASDGKVIDNLDVLKNSYRNSLRNVNIEGTDITSDDIINSEIKKLNWTSFLP